MALTKIVRHRAPLDGSWFQTTANLNSILRAACLYDDDMTWPKIVDDVRVPVFIRMERYLAQVTHRRPDGMMFGPVIRVGTMDSPDAEMFGHHHACGLFNDYHLDRYDPDNEWLYTPQGPFTSSSGEDVSVYRCDLCNNNLYRDDMGRRHDRSACLFDGALVCRDCEVTGLVYSQEVEDRLVRCRTLADQVGRECRKSFERMIERLSGGFSFGHPSQTRLFNDGQWSFFWRTVVHTPAGNKEGMHGGLIQHGPHPSLCDDGSFRFTTWDYGLKREREATAEEVGNIHWGIHT